MFLSVAGLHKLSFGVYDSDECHVGKIPLISELSELYGFEFLPQLKIVTVGSADNLDEDEEQYQQEFEDADSARLYYKKYRYCPQPKEQNNMENLNQALDSLKSQRMDEQHVELLFLKEKIEEKLKQLKFNSENFKELKSVLHDVTHLMKNI